MTLAERLKAKRDDKPIPYRPHVITVRMSQELHQRIKQLSYEERVSMNELAVTALEYACEDMGTPNPERR